MKNISTNDKNEKIKFENLVSLNIKSNASVSILQLHKNSVKDQYVRRNGMSISVLNNSLLNELELKVFYSRHCMFN